MWDHKQYIVFDLESSGELPEYALQPWRVPQGKAWVTSWATADCLNGQMQFQGQHWDGVAPMDFADQIRPVLQRCIDENITMVGWNIAFDVAWLIAYGMDDLVKQMRFLDGMLLWRHLDIEPEYETVRDKKRSYSLKPAVAQYYPAYANYEENVDYHSRDIAEIRKLYEYNIKDVAFTYGLTRQFYEELAKEPQRLAAALIETEAIYHVAGATVRGMRIDLGAIENLVKTLDQAAADALATLAPHGVTEKIVRSPIQLATLLFDTWGLPVMKENTGKKTGKVSRATDKEVLHELSLMDARAKVLRTYRESLNNKTKFAEAPLNSVIYNGDGCSHPTARIFGTYSGRMTYDSKQGRNKNERQTGFAIHQEKRGKDFRNIVAAPEGYTICEFDAAGQEFRWMAIASGDDTMLQLCLPGEDPHGYMGAQIVGRDYRELVAAVKAGEKEAKEARQLGKVANLSLQYRTSPPKLRTVARVQYNLPMDLPDAKQIHRTYLSSYPGVPRYWQEQIHVCSALGYAETFGGRRVQLRDDFYGERAWSLASTAINYRIQGTGADQKYLALCVLKPYMVKHGIYFGWELHDGIYLYIPDDKVSQCVPEIKTILATLPYKRAWNFEPPVPLPWDAKTGKRWGDLKDWEG